MNNVAQKPIGNRTFTTSLAISLLVHLILLVLATRIRVLDQDALTLEATRMFRVKPVEAEARPRPKLPPQRAEPPLSLDEFLRRERQRPELPPIPEEFQRELESQLTERVTGEHMVREHDTEPASTMLEAIDLEVIAIEKRFLGDKIDVTRRLIPARKRVAVLPPEVMPTLARRGIKRVKLAQVQPPAPAAVKAEERPPKPTDVLPKRKERPLLPLDREILKTPKVERVPLREKPELVQKYPSLDDLLEIALVTYDVPDGDGYFLARISPRHDRTLETMPKQIVFVIDVSKSIRETKLEQSKKGLMRCLEKLNEGDLFNIIAFKRSPTVFRSKAVRPTPSNIRAAHQFIKSLKPTGETDVYSAIAPLVRVKGPETHPYTIFLITDGKPTTGMLDSRRIINNLTRQNDLRASIFTFAGGTEVNTYLLDLLAHLNKGRSHVARRVYDIEDEMPRFYRSIKDPILKGLHANYANIDEAEIYPKVLPDFYMGGEILVYGRYGKTKTFSMRLTGTVNGEKKELVFKRDFADAKKGGSDTARMWAFRKIYKLIADVCQQGAQPELLEEIAALGSMESPRLTAPQESNVPPAT